MGRACPWAAHDVSVVSVYCVFANAEEAERIGRTVVEEGLAACINILGACRSIYRWQGVMETADEVPAVFKTTRESSEALIARIAAMHSYDVPCIAVWPIEKLLLSYSEWVEAVVGSRD
jgi:periplasmic divalent cation tolerance protein